MLACSRPHLCVRKLEELTKLWWCKPLFHRCKWKCTRLVFWHLTKPWPRVPSKQSLLLVGHRWSNDSTFPESSALFNIYWPQFSWRGVRRNQRLWMIYAASSEAELRKRRRTETSFSQKGNSRNSLDDSEALFTFSIEQHVEKSILFKNLNFVYL